MQLDSRDKCLNAKDVQEWAEYELAALKVKAKEMIKTYFCERKERCPNLKIWPRLKEYAAGQTFYVTWSTLEYVNPKRKVLRTKHLKKGWTCKKKIENACRGSNEGYEFAMSYYERFERLGKEVEALGKILANVRKLESLEKEEKEMLFRDPNICEGM